MMDAVLRLDRDELERFLADGLDRRLALTLTGNRVSLIRLRAGPGGGLDLRANEALLRAPPEVLRALKRFLVSGRRSDWRAVCAFMRAAPRPEGPPRVVRVRTAGRVHDLQAILDGVNADHFPGPCACRITWGKGGARRRRRRRHIAYGSYHREPGLIRIHPLLDDQRVPREFVAFIVYHERLHAELGAEERGGRQCHHTRQFRMRERLFPDFDRLQALARTLFLTLDKPEGRSWTDVFRFA